MPDTPPRPADAPLPVRVPLATVPLGVMGTLRAGRRNVLELAVPSPDDAMRRLLPQLPSVARRGRRLRVPLGAGTSPESVLALCRDVGVAVRASRVAEEPVPR